MTMMAWALQLNLSLWPLVLGTSGLLSLSRLAHMPSSLVLYFHNNLTLFWHIKAIILCHSSRTHGCHSTHICPTSPPLLTWRPTPMRVPPHRACLSTQAPQAVCWPALMEDMLISSAKMAARYYCSLGFRVSVYVQEIWFCKDSQSNVSKININVGFTNNVSKPLCRKTNPYEKHVALKQKVISDNCYFLFMSPFIFHQVHLIVQENLCGRLTHFAQG